MLDLPCAKGPRISTQRTAVSAVCAKDKNRILPGGRGLLPSAPAAKRSARVLGGLGGASALKTVRAAVDSSGRNHAAAIRAGTGDRRRRARPARTGQTSPGGRQSLACGVLRLAADADARRPAALCQQAAALTQQTDEKKLLLGALGGIKNTESPP